jgi:hypothetical protein
MKLGETPIKIRGVHHYSYRQGQEATVFGLKWVQPHDGADWRVCYEIFYPDQLKFDYVPISEVENGNYALS